MSWTEGELREMIDRRLSAYSSERVKSLNGFVEEELRGKIYDLILHHSLRSPREIVQIIDAIFREHARHSTMENGAMITAASVDKGLDDYCVRRVKDLYPTVEVHQIIKLPLRFTSSQFQTTF